MKVKIPGPQSRSEGEDCHVFLNLGFTKVRNRGMCLSLLDTLNAPSLNEDLFI